MKSLATQQTLSETAILVSNVPKTHRKNLYLGIKEHILNPKSCVFKSDSPEVQSTFKDIINLYNGLSKDDKKDFATGLDGLSKFF